MLKYSGDSINIVTSSICVVGHGRSGNVLNCSDGSDLFFCLFLFFRLANTLPIYCVETPMENKVGDDSY